jgi:hypothetical protein
MIIRSGGFVASEMIRSQNALNFAFVLYLKLRSMGAKDELIERYVRRWFVLSILTGRYSGSSESQFDYDIRQVAERDFGAVLKGAEDAELSAAFWDVGLPQSLDTSGTSAPYFWVWVAAQIKANDKGLLSRDIGVRELVTHLGDVHHIFPRDLLKKAGLNRGQYNQIANYAYTQEEINIRVGNKAPNVYFADVAAQCAGAPLKYGAISNRDTLMENLVANCIPKEIFEMGTLHYEKFLIERRALMAKKLRSFYDSL